MRAVIHTLYSTRGEASRSRHRPEVYSSALRGMQSWLIAQISLGPVAAEFSFEKLTTLTGVANFDPRLSLAEEEDCQVGRRFASSRTQALAPRTKLRTPAREARPSGRRTAAPSPGRPVAQAANKRANRRRRTPGFCPAGRGNATCRAVRRIRRILIRRHLTAAFR